MNVLVLYVNTGCWIIGTLDQFNLEARRVFHVCRNKVQKSSSAIGENRLSLSFRLILSLVHPKKTKKEKKTIRMLNVKIRRIPSPRIPSRKRPRYRKRRHFGNAWTCCKYLNLNIVIRLFTDLLKMKQKRQFGDISVATKPDY